MVISIYFNLVIQKCGGFFPLFVVTYLIISASAFLHCIARSQLFSTQNTEWKDSV